MTWEIIAILIVSGIFVGFVNTLAGGGSIVSMAIFMGLGLPITDANGTNRIAVVLQNLTATVTFLRKRMLDVRLGLKLSVPTILGNIAGSQIASTVDETVFKWCLGAVMTAMLIYMVLDRRTRFHGEHELNLKPMHYLWFFLIGFYGGYIYIGLGYMVLAVAMMSMRLDVVTANVIKGFVTFVATPFSLIIFIMHGQVHYAYGLLHGLGNVIGAFLASHYAVHWNVKYIKAFMFVVIVVCLVDLFTPESIFRRMVNALLGEVL